MEYQIDQLKEAGNLNNIVFDAHLNQFHDDAYVIGFDGSIIDIADKYVLLKNCYLYIFGQYWWKIDEHAVARYIDKPNHAAQMTVLLLS